MRASHGRSFRGFAQSLVKKFGIEKYKTRIFALFFVGLFGRMGTREEIDFLLGKVVIKMGSVGCPVMKEIAVDWHGAEKVTSIQKSEKSFCIRVKIANKTKTLTVSFPKVGGVRIADGCGFFEYADALPIAYSGKKYLRMTAGDTTVVFCKDTQYGFVLKIENAVKKTVLTLKGTDLQFGLTGNKIKKVQKFKFGAAFEDQEVLYGLGERYNRFNQVGCRAYLWNIDTGFGKDTQETYQNIPLLHSSAGYTLFFNNTYGGWADFGVETANMYTFDYAGPTLDVFIFTGTPIENLDCYTAITGRPILPPKWAYQYWMGGGIGAWRYGDKTYSENLQEYLDGYAAMGIKHIAACFGEASVCETEECYKQLEESGCRMLFWTWPGLISSYGQRILGGSIEDIKNMPMQEYTTKVGKIVLGSDAVEDQPFPKVKKNGKWTIPTTWYDFTHPNVHKLLRGRMDRYFKMGLKGSMVDFGEYIHPDWQMHNGDSGMVAHNQHPYWYGKAMFEMFHEYCGDDHILFQRAGCAGSQHWTVHFGGDQQCNTKGLNQALTGLVTASASGMPTWGSDIAGLGGAPTDETYVRWLQHGAFSPLMRAHAGGGRPGSNPWNYGEVAMEVFSRLYWWRENMLPYIYSHAIHAHKTGAPIVYPLAMMYQNDVDLTHVEDQYLFGTELLVAPVTIEKLNWRMVRFPDGKWVNLWTGDVVDGGRELYVEAPLNTIPVYVREGAAMVLELPQETLAPCENMEEVPRVNALLVTPTTTKREVVFYDDAQKAYRLVTERVTDEAVTVTNADGLQLGGLLVYGCMAQKVLVDGEAVEFTAEDNKTVIHTPNGFNKIEVF